MKGFLVLLVPLITLGCVGVSVRTTGAASVADLQAEEHYKSVYAEQMGALHEDLQRFVPSNTSPGVCNKGGSQPACYAADTKMIEGLRTMLAALQATEVPPRFIEADRLLQDAITQNINGLDLRNKAIADLDNDAWTQQKAVLDAALAAFGNAYEAFPEDNRPVPAP